MGVYIPNMEMPKSCLDCKWLESWMQNITPTSMDKIYIVPRYFCYILRKNIDLKKSSKADDCPLVEVPPHGRLIDADAVYKRIHEAIDDDPQLSDVYVEDAQIVTEWLRTEPTIIEREDGDA